MGTSTSADGAPERSRAEPLQDRQREGRRLAGAGRRLPEQVAAREQRRDRLALDRRGLLVAQSGERFEQLRPQFQVGEGRHVAPSDRRLAPAPRFGGFPEGSQRARVRTVNRTMTKLLKRVKRHRRNNDRRPPSGGAFASASRTKALSSGAGAAQGTRSATRRRDPAATARAGLGDGRRRERRAAATSRTWGTVY